MITACTEDLESRWRNDAVSVNVLAAKSDDHSMTVAPCDTVLPTMTERCLAKFSSWS